MTEFISKLDVRWQVLIWAALAVIFILVAWGLTRLNKIAFRKIQNRRKGLHLAFLERINSVVIVAGFAVLAISAFVGVRSVWQTLLGGTAVISAVLAFAAQDIIKDVLAGLMLSAHKPFEIGDRIVLEDGTAGIVEDMTMRHVVLRGFDTLRYVIPNSRINTARLSNFSYKREILSVEFRFSVSYDSDMPLVKKTIYNAVERSEYSVPGLEENGELRYAPVYFVSFADSALIMSVTVYFDRKHPPEVVIDDVNTGVREALTAHGIEIPYNYVTVVDKREG